MSVVSVMQRQLGSRRLRRLPVRPRHVGVVMDGNRRWARAAGYTDPEVGHRTGAEHLGELLRWSDVAGVEHLTVYVLSADNLRRRPSDQIAALHRIVQTTLIEAIEDVPGWRVHLSGDLSLLPPDVAASLRALRDRTTSRGKHLTLAIGYDGRQDIVDGVRGALLRSTSSDIADLDTDRITASLAGGPVKDIDLVIRTSGEQRLSGFCPWQTQHAEVFVSPKLWPAFARRDFAAALHYYAEAAARRAD